MEYQLTIFHGSVYRFIGRLEAHTPCFQVSHDFEKMRQRPPHPIQSPDRQNIASIERPQKLFQLWTFDRCTRYFFGDNLLAPSGHLRVTLCVRVLGNGLEAGISNFLANILRKITKISKSPHSGSFWSQKPSPSEAGQSGSIPLPVHILDFLNLAIMPPAVSCQHAADFCHDGASG